MPKRITSFDGIDHQQDVDDYVDLVRKRLAQKVKEMTYERTAQWLHLPVRWVFEFISGRIKEPSLSRVVYVARCLGMGVNFPPRKSFPPNVSF